MQSLDVLIARVHAYHDQFEAIHSKRCEIRELNESHIRKNIKHLLAELLEYFVRSSDAIWSDRSSTAPRMPGVLHTYQTPLDTIYHLQIKWHDSPVVSKNKDIPKTRQYYSVSIVGKKKVVVKRGVLGVGRIVKHTEFPSISIQIEQLIIERVFAPINKAEHDLLALGEHVRKKVHEEIA